MNARRNRLVDFAERLATHPLMEQAVMGAVRATLPTIAQQVATEMFGGEPFKMYAQKIASPDRLARDQRIGAAIAAGEANVSISRRENVSLRHVQRMRKRSRMATG